MKQIFRYEPEIFREDRIRMEMDSQGDWIKYEEIKDLLKRVIAQLEHIDSCTHEHRGANRNLVAEIDSLLGEQP